MKWLLSLVLLYLWGGFTVMYALIEFGKIAKGLNELSSGIKGLDKISLIGWNVRTVVIVLVVWPIALPIWVIKSGSVSRGTLSN